MTAASFTRSVGVAQCFAATVRASKEPHYQYWENAFHPIFLIGTRNSKALPFIGLVSQSGYSTGHTTIRRFASS
jgi:hypothetical protein